MSGTRKIKMTYGCNNCITIEITCAERTLCGRTGCAALLTTSEACISRADLWDKLIALNHLTLFLFPAKPSTCATLYFPQNIIFFYSLSPIFSLSCFKLAWHRRHLGRRACEMGSDCKATLSANGIQYEKANLCNTFGATSENAELGRNARNTQFIPCPRATITEKNLWKWTPSCYDVQKKRETPSTCKLILPHMTNWTWKNGHVH